jgi:hypothetical protein
VTTLAIVDGYIELLGVTGSDELVAEAAGKSANFADLDIPISAIDVAAKSVNVTDLNIQVIAEEFANFASCPPHTGRAT